MIVLKGEYIFDHEMYSPMIVERKDPNWFLLEQVLAVVTTRRAQQEFAKYEITPINSAAEAVKIAIVAMFFFSGLCLCCPGIEGTKEIAKIHWNPRSSFGGDGL